MFWHIPLSFTNQQQDKPPLRLSLCSFVKVAQSCPTLRLHGLHSSRNSPGQNTGVGSISLLQGIFPTQESNPGVPHCRQILYQLTHKGSPRILQWVSLLQRTFLTQESNQGLMHCRWILYQLSYEGSPDIIGKQPKNTFTDSPTPLFLPPSIPS